VNLAEAQGPTEVSLPTAFLDRAPPMYTADRGGRLRYANEAFHDLKSSLGEDLRVVAQQLDADHAELVVRHSFERDGEVRHFRAHHFLTEDGFGGIYTDVTREAQALIASAEMESRFRDVIRSASDWVWETDASLNLTYVSERITEALEVLPHTLVGRNLMLIGEFEERAPAMRERLQRDFLPFRGQTFLMKDARGETRRIHLSGVPVFEAVSGRFAGYRGTGTDVTVRHKAEQGLRNYQTQLQDSLAQLKERNVQLDDALKSAEAAVRAKTDFLGKMSHELRTPLNAVIGFSELAAQQIFGPLNDHYVTYFRDIRSAAYHLLNIINDILDAVSVESAKVQVESQPVALDDVVAESKALVALRAEQDGIDLSRVRIDGAWTALADPNRTRQILVNLLNNAVKFTDRGGRIGIEVAEKPGNALAITVWDTGMGIPADQQERIFESFHQVGSDLLVSPREGSGLGLSVSRQLARLMQGDLTVESTPGKGSRFTLTLPKATETAKVA
jgi:PAS domain S-box-containing protein